METWDVRILCSSYNPRDDQATVELYGKTRGGESITLLAKGFHPYFFIIDPAESLAAQLSKDEDVVEVKNDDLMVRGSMHPVLKVTIRNPWQMSDFTNRLRSKYSLLGTDIPFQDRYVYDMDLGSCIRVTGERIESEYRTDITAVISTTENIEPFDPGLKILSFDIENSVKMEFLYTICTVVSDSDGIRNCDSATGTEAEIISKFTETILREDPDVITGYNIENYDIRKIIERAKANKMQDSLTWGRDLSTPRLISDRFWRVKGRLVVDAWWAAKRELRPKQETLNAVSMQVLGEQKLDVDPKYMDEEWQRDSAKVIRYCYKDAELALRILLAVGTVRKGMDLAAVSKLPVEDVLTSGTSTLVDSILIRAADREKIGVPANGRMSRTDQIEGGYVHTMNPGLYHWVCVLDFKSMYPSLIIAKNICFTTLSADGEIESPNGVRYMSKERRNGLLPRILSNLMAERDSIKKRMKSAKDPREHDYLDGLQAAVKVLMNTFYGVFASSFYRFTDKQIGSSITAFARWTVKTIIGELESEGYKVIYSDTDSVFVESPNHDLDGSVEFGNRMADKYSKDGGTLEFEKILEPLFSHGKKKRYVGRLVWPEATDELFIRGYEIRRSDSFDLQSDMLMKLFNYILDENNKDALAMVRTTIGKVLRGDVPASELVISRTCKGLDAYENPERQANIQTAKKLIAMGYEFIPGMKVSWIVTDSSKTPQVVEPYISGKEFTARPDYKYYAERLSQTASRITEVFGWTEKDLMSGMQQSTLFDGFGDAEGDAEDPMPAPPKPPSGKGRNMKLTDFF